MIKKLFLAIMIALPSLAFAQGKFGTVDVQDVLAAMPEVTEMNTQLETASKKYDEEYKKLIEEYNKMYTEFQNLDADTPDAIKERRIQELQSYETKVTQFRTTAETDLRSQQEKLMAPIEEKLQKAIETVGSEGAYTFIFQSAMPTYIGTDVTDVTPAVKTKLGLK